MSLYGGIEDHPDLNDAEWGNRVEREFRKEQRGGRRLVIGLVAAFAVAALVAGGLLLGGLHEGPARPPGSVDFARPFAGTDFETWAVGERGVVAAPEHEQVRQAVVAARLNPDVLLRHDPAAFLALLPAEAREIWSTQLPTLVTRLKDGTALLPDGIRVYGTIAPAVDEEGVEVVRSDYRIAYAFAPADLTVARSHEDIIVTVHAVADYRVIPEGLQIRNTQVLIDNSACSTKTDGYLAPRLGEGTTCGVSA